MIDLDQDSANEGTGKEKERVPGVPVPYSASSHSTGGATGTFNAKMKARDYM